MNETLKVLESRRSCRKFVADKMPSEADIEAVIRAGAFAPSGMGRQPVRIIAVTNKAVRDEISAENARIMRKDAGFDPFYGAPVILLVVADKSATTYLYDGSLVMGNLMNAAESLGLASIWIHRAKEEVESDFGKRLLKDAGLEGDFEGVGHVALGYAAEGGTAPAAERKQSVYWVR